MATDHNFKVKNGLTVLGDTLVVNHTGDVDGTQVYIKKKDSSTNLMRWGEGTSGATTYKWRIDQNYDFIGNNGSDVIVLKSSDGSIQAQSYKIGSSTVIDSSRNLTNINNITAGGNLTVTGNLTINGTTTTLNTATLQVEDKNIVLNYGTGDTSASANGAGITIQDAINSSTDATILWNSSSNRFDFSHKVSAAGDVSGYNFYGQDHYVLNAAASGWHKWAERANNKVNLNVNTITSSHITSENINIAAGSGQRHIEIASGTTGAKTYRIYNGISWNPDALLIYNHTDDSTVLTIEPGRLGVNKGASSLTKTLEVGGTGLFTASGTSTSPVLGITATNSGSFIHGTNLFAANLAAGQFVGHFFGRVGSTKNAGGIGYTYSSAGSNDNYVSIGHWGADHLLRVYGSGTVRIASGALEMGSNTVIDSSRNFYPNGMTTSSGVTIGGGLTTGTINVTAQDSSNEGGEIVLKGSGSNEDINIDNYSGTFRIFDGSTPQVRLTLDTSGNATFSGSVNVSGDLNIASAIAHTGDLDTYFQFNAANTARIVVGGSQKFVVNSNGVSINNGALDMTSNNISNVGTISSGAITTTTGAITVKYGATSNISLTPTASGGVINARNSSGTSVVVMDARGTPFLDVTGNLKTGGTTRIDSSGNATLGTINSVGRHTITGGATGDILLKMGSSTQTQYVDLQMASNSGVGELFKNGTAFTSYGGASSFNVYNSNGLIAFHPSNTANVLQIDTTGLNVGASRTIRMNGTTVIDSNRRFYASDGTVGAPAFSFSADTNTGFYRYTTDQIGFAIAGAHRGTIDNDALRHFGREYQLGEKQVMRSSALAAPSNTTQRNRYTILEVSYNTHHWMSVGVFKIRVDQTYPLGADYAEYLLHVGYLHTNGSGSQGGSGANSNDFVLTRVYSSKAAGNYDHEIVVGTPTDTGYDSSSYDVYKVPIYLENDHYAQHRVTIEAPEDTFSRVTSFTGQNQFIFMPSYTATTLSGQVANPLPNNQSYYGVLRGYTKYDRSTTLTDGTAYYVQPSETDLSAKLAGNLIAGGGFSPTGSVIGGVRAYGNTSAYMSAADQAGRTAFFGVDTSGYAMFGALTNHNTVIRANNQEKLRIQTNGVISIASGGVLAMNGTTVIDSSSNLTNIGTISSGAITATGTGTTTATFTNTSGNGGYVNIASNVGNVNTDGTVGLHIGWNKSNGGREVNMIFDGGTSQADTEMIFTSTDGSTYTDIFQINGATSGTSAGVDIKTGGLLVGGNSVINSSRNLLNIGTISSSYFNATSNVNSTSQSGIQLPNMARIGFDQSGTRSWTVGPSNGTLTVFSGDGAGEFNLANDIKFQLDSHTFVAQEEYSGTSIFSQSGDWYTLASINENTTPAYFALKFGAHSTVTFVVTTGYVHSNVATINVLASTWTQNGGYPGASELRIVKQSNSSVYHVQMRLTYSSGPTGFTLAARTWGATPATGTPVLVTSLSAYSETHTTIAHVYTNYNGTGSSEAHYIDSGSNTYPSYSFSGDTNTGMYLDTTDSIGFATNGAQRVTISNSGLDVKSAGALIARDTADLSTSGGYTRVTTGSLAASNAGTRGFIMDGNYTDGRYRHRWRKQDNGGGVPLYLDSAGGTANSFGAIARFGQYTGASEEFEVYGNAKVSGKLAVHHDEDNGPTMTITTTNPGSWGASLAVGATDAAHTLVDGNDRPMVIIDGQYPVLNLNHTATSNDNHGPTIQFTHEGYNSNRQWVIGTDGQGQRLDFGVSGGTAGTNSNKNPHNGIAGYQGKTLMRIFEDGVLVGNTGSYSSEISSVNAELDVRGSLYVEAASDETTYSGVHSHVIRNTVNSGGGNGANLLVQNDRGNHSWGTVAEFRVNTSSDSDNPSIIFTSAAEGTNTWGVGFGYTDTSFRINRDHGHLNSNWGTAMMTLDRSGNVTFAGNVTAYSDVRLKENIETIPDAVETVKKIRGVTFDWKETGEEGMGVIAQELEEVPILKRLVTETPIDGVSEFAQKNVAYGNLTGLLIEAVKEQQQKIEKLEELVEKLISEK